MIPLWSWWLSGLALAVIPILHWISLRRALAVSGRFSALVNRLRFGEPEALPEALDPEALLAAIRAATEEAFGEGSVSEPPSPSEPDASAPPALAPRKPEGAYHHALFLGGLLLGGLLSGLAAGAPAVGMAMAGSGFQATFGASGVMPWVVLGSGGLCVGFGTRMAGGCTSGHGLCGVSQLQVGSLAATCAFFGMGIVTSMLLEVLL